MKTIRFTQDLNVVLTIEAEVPDDWTEDDTYDYSKELSLTFTVNEDPMLPNLFDANITGLSLDSVYLTDTHDWKEQ